MLTDPSGAARRKCAPLTGLPVSSTRRISIQSSLVGLARAVPSMLVSKRALVLADELVAAPAFVLTRAAACSGTALAAPPAPVTPATQAFVLVAVRPEADRGAAARGPAAPLDSPTITFRDPSASWPMPPQ